MEYEREMNIKEIVGLNPDNGDLTWTMVVQSGYDEEILDGWGIPPVMATKHDRKSDEQRGQWN